MDNLEFALENGGIIINVDRPICELNKKCKNSGIDQECYMKGKIERECPFYNFYINKSRETTQ